MNSFKLVCSFAKRTPMSFNELEENVETLLGREVSVELVVGHIGIFKTTEHLDDAFHIWRNFTTASGDDEGHGW